MYPLVNRCDRFIRRKKRMVRFGNVFFEFLTDDSQRAMFYGWFGAGVEKAIRRYLSKGGCFVDVGANVGYYTAIAASVAGPSGRYYAFEPQRDHFERLSRLALLNRGLFAVTCVNAAVTDQDGPVRFYECNHPGWHTTEGGHFADGCEYREQNVEGMTLDAFARKEGLECIDMVKIDVEGTEEKVLRGAKELIQQKRIKAMIVEVNYPGNGLIAPAIKLLTDWNWISLDTVTGQSIAATAVQQSRDAICFPRHEVPRI
jgi:FkbM family methyltransferase